VTGGQDPHAGGIYAANQAPVGQSPLLAAQGASRSVGERLTGGGTHGNERLTAATGVILLALLAVIGLTLLALRPLLSVHLFVGMLLLGPVALKMGSTGYRFVRYYTGNPAYRRVGPPVLALRLIAPMVVLSTATVFASGVALLLIGPSSRESLLPIHKVSFVVWGVFTALHVLGHLPGLPGALRPDYTRSAGLPGYRPGRAGRLISIACAIAAGGVIAVLTLPQFGPWLHAHDHFLRH
jgi:hypothetical protein